MPSWFRRRPEPEPPPDTSGWPALLHRRLPGWDNLDAGEQHRLITMVETFIGAKRWEAARGFTITEEMQVTVAAQGMLLVLELGTEWLDDVASIILHPSTITLRGEHAGPVPGVRTDEPVSLIGEAHFRGPVLVAWDAARYQAAHPRTGNNVVIHEFAHHLDMLGGVIDGTPPIEDPELRRRWIDVCTAEFGILHGYHRDTILRSYASTDPGEFFAVASEVFFTKPQALRDSKPELYEVFAAFYRQDPAGRADRAAERASQGG